jgi:hypothetical protein
MGGIGSKIRSGPSSSRRDGKIVARRFIAGQSGKKDIRRPFRDGCRVGLLNVVFCRPYGTGIYLVSPFPGDESPGYYQMFLTEQKVVDLLF